MRVFLTAAATGLATIALTSVAWAKKILIVTGIFGTILSPMRDVGADLQVKGHDVTYAQWFYMPQGQFDVAIGHSAGDQVLRTQTKRIITVDPTFINVGCPKGANCKNHYNRMNAFPFVFCCGGWRVVGATNKVNAHNHVGMPRELRHQLVAEATAPRPKVKNKKLKLPTK